MQIEEILGTEHPSVVFAILAALGGFLLFYFIAHSGRIKSLFEKRLAGDQLMIRWVMYQKFWGFLSMGFLPAAAFALFFKKIPPAYGLNYTSAITYWPWLLLMLIIPPAANYFLARRPSNLKQYPQMRISKWTWQRFALNSLGWFAYLLAYEYLFRGLLLFPVYEAYGLWTAISVNIALYSLAHLYKGAGETLGAIPFGLLLCLVTLYTGTILLSFLLHLALALSNDYLSIRFNPDMSFNRYKKSE